MSRRVSILGSTGSIGRQTLEVIEANSGAFEVVALAAGRNVERLAEQVHRFSARNACRWRMMQRRRLYEIEWARIWRLAWGRPGSSRSRSMIPTL